MEIGDTGGSERAPGVTLSSHPAPENALVTAYVVEIPAFLHNSGFYRSLDVDEEHSTIEIPRTCFKLDDSAKSRTEVRQLLNIFMYWGLDEIPFSVLDYCVENFWALGEVTSHLPIGSDLCRILNTYSTQTIWTNDTGVRSELVRHWIQSNPPDGSSTQSACHIASLYGITPLLKQLHSSGYPLNHNGTSLYSACLRGHLDCLKYLRENGCEWSSNDCSVTVSGGHLRCLQYFHDCGFPLDNPDYCTAAAQQGHFDCLKFLHEVDCPWDSHQIPVDAAFASNGFDCTKYAIENGCELHENLTKAQNIDVLKYVLEKDGPVHRDALHIAMRRGAPVECVRRLYEMGAHWDESEVTSELGRNFEYLTLVLTSGWPCNTDDLVERAVHFGQHKHLKYLIEEALLPMDNKIFSTAMLYGNLKCILYLLEVGCPSDFVCSEEDPPHIFDTQLLVCVQAAVEYGWSCNEAFVRFVKKKILLLCEDYLCQEGWTTHSCVDDACCSHIQHHLACLYEGDKSQLRDFLQSVSGKGKSLCWQCRSPTL